MSLYQTLYYMSLVGGMAGLFSWGINSLIASILPSQTYIEGSRLSNLLAAMLLGAFIGGLTIGFSDRWSGNRVMPRWVVSGTLIGILAGLFASLVQIPITDSLPGDAAFTKRLIVWTVVGSFIGLGLGLRWVHVNRARVVHACAGGLIGGALGGVIFGIHGPIPELSEALGFLSVGVGICFGITLAPILLRDGVLQFVSSGDPRAQSKFGRMHKEWEFQRGDSCVIGSQSQDLSQTRYRPDVEIFIPDAAIAPKHALLFEKDGRFFLARHGEVGGQAGMARYVTRVRGKSVTSSSELRDSDDIMVGRTALKFVTKRKEQ